jgi:Zinc finger, C2H2 type
MAPESCPICGGTFDSAAAVAAHTEQQHASPRSRSGADVSPSSEGERAEFSCAECGKTFPSDLELTTHATVVHPTIRKM